jgi:hypothetical protein
MASEDIRELRVKVSAFKGTWTTDKGMSFFLITMIVVIFVVFPLSGVSVSARLLADVAFTVMIISGALAVRRNRVLTGLLILLAISILLFHWRAHFAQDFHPRVFASLVMAQFGCIVVVMLVEVFRPGQVTFHRVQGAVAAYLSIGLTWAYAYYLASQISPGAVQFNTEMAANEIPVERYVYFSFMTLTTVGYGDAIPVHPLTRTLAISEALLGQLYPAILIAGVLGLALAARAQGTTADKH